jgi:Ni,Fe-hydrogenase III small subunit
VAFLTQELLDEKPVLEVHRAMFKDLVAMQKKSGTRDVHFVAVQGLPLKAGKKTSLLIAATTRDGVEDWLDRFHAAVPKPKLVAEGTCVFAKGADGQIAIELKKITGAARKVLVEAMTKGLAKDPRFAVKDAQVRPRPSAQHGEESSEDEGDERH